MNYCTDLILGKAFCIFIFFHFPDSRLSVLKRFPFLFLLSQVSENREEGIMPVYQGSGEESVLRLLWLYEPAI